jgi:NAD(P)-dependent dehydrogenase (short-subunit alcohol dehydrogenase family)
VTGTAEFDFTGARVLVTGATRGIGLGVATAFAHAGADVVVTGTRPTAADYDDDLSAFVYRQVTMTDDPGVDELARSLDRLDVLVNNAGANLPGGRDEWEPDVFRESVGINLLGAFRLAVGCRPRLAASSLAGGGSVVNVASMASYFAVPMVPGYAAAKAGIVQLTKNLAVTWAAEGIRVNAVAPGLIESDMTAAMKEIDELARPHLDRTPMGRWGTPGDLAPAVLFLASDAARFVTGQTLPVDGGYSVA